MTDLAPLFASALTVTGIWAVTVMTPGPNFVATVHTAAESTPRHGVMVALGIAVGTAIWAMGSLAGLGLLFQTFGGLYLAVKIAGALYLIYVGIRMMMTRTRNDEGEPVVAMRSLWGAFRHGLLTDLANPKAAAFFASLFAVAVPPDAPLWFDAGLVCAVVLIAGGWYAAAALAMGQARIAAAYRRLHLWITRVAGACFVLFGAKLAMDR